MELHQHQIGDYLKCPRLFYLRHVKNWTLKTQKRYINVGSLFAKGVEHIHDGKPMDWIFKEVLDPSANELISKANNNEIVEHIITDTQTVEAMLNGYKKWFIDENDLIIPKIDVVRPEYKIQIPVSIYNFSFTYICRLDGLCYDSNDHRWILEIKTSALDAGLLVRQLATNFQINSYFMALSYDKALSSAHPTDGVLYRVVKKPTIKQKKTEDVGQFRQRLTIDYLTRKDFYFLQMPIYFKESANKEFVTDFGSWIEKLRDAYENEIWPKNGFSCRFGFAECNFLKYCAEPTDETFLTYYKVKEREEENEADEDRGNDEPDF